MCQPGTGEKKAVSRCADEFTSAHDRRKDSHPVSWIHTSWCRRHTPRGVSLLILRAPKCIEDVRR
jgi:hypothetical protein